MVSKVQSSRLLPGAKIGWSAYLLLFLSLFVPPAIVATSLFYWSLQVRVGQELSGLQSHETGQVKAAAHVLQHDFEKVTSDLMILAHAPFVRRFLESGSAEHKKGMTELFVDVLQEKQIYDQIRYLDASGKEVIRINLQAGKAQVVPEADLQDKKGRYFFQDSIRLSEDEVYVSPLDLNIEQGKIETPYKPMIRIGTPVFNRAGEKKGVILLNLYGGKLIDDFLQGMGAEGHEMLINRDGDWLSSPDRSQEWGFMFGNPHAFAKRYPVEWQTMSAGKTGSFITATGLLTYDTVYPLRASQHSSTGSPLPVGASSRELGQTDYFWKVVSFVPIADVPAVTSPAQRSFLTAFGFVLVLLASLSGYLTVLLINRRRLRQEVFDSEKQLREITSTLGEGVYVLDEAGLITYVNPEAERLLGWSSEGLLGQHAHNLFHHHLEDGTFLPESECAINKVIQSGQVYRNEDEMFWRKDGSSLPVGVSSSPIFREGKVAGSVVAFQDVTERKRSHEEIRRLALYDTLTDLPNRRLLLDRLSRSLVQAKRYQRSLAIMFLDLDHFKEINDTLGHDVGDELLKVVATRLHASVRDGDTVARQGGDEFVVLLAEVAQPEDATQVAEKLLLALQEPILVNGHELHISGSVGISIYPVNGTDDVQELMKKADIAMYAAKQAGRNRYCIYDSTPHGIAAAKG